MCRTLWVRATLHQTSACRASCGETQQARAVLQEERASVFGSEQCCWCQLYWRSNASKVYSDWLIPNLPAMSLQNYIQSFLVKEITGGKLGTVLRKKKTVLTFCQRLTIGTGYQASLSPQEESPIKKIAKVMTIYCDCDSDKEFISDSNQWMFILP